MTDNKDRILSILCLVCGVAAYPLVCRWYLGVMAAVAAIVIFIYHGMHYERNRLTTTGALMGLTLLLLVILTAAAFGMYMSLVSGGDDINWDRIRDAMQFK